MLPEYEEVRDSAFEERETRRLKILFLACSLYADEWNGHFPENLEKNLQEFFDFSEPLLFQNPSTKHESPYVYNAGLTYSSPEDLFLLATPEAVFSGKRLVGTVGGKVLALSEKEFQARQAQTESYLKENPAPHPLEPSGPLPGLYSPISREEVRAFLLEGQHQGDRP